MIMTEYRILCNTWVTIIRSSRNGRGTYCMVAAAGEDRSRDGYFGSGERLSFFGLSTDTFCLRIKLNFTRTWMSLPEIEI